MKDPTSIRTLIRAINKLPPDKPIDRPGIWYQTQHQHWIGWLSEYHGPGRYGRQTGIKRDAKFAYNHIVNPQMLLWLISASGVNRTLVSAATRAGAHGTTRMQKAKIIRAVVPWEFIAKALWPNYSGGK
jgi:hypothetical protein